MIILEGADLRFKMEIRVQQQIAYSTAVLFSIASNKPSKFPKFDKVFPDPDSKQKAQTPDEIADAMFGWVEDAERVELH